MRSGHEVIASRTAGFDDSLDFVVPRLQAATRHHAGGLVLWGQVNVRGAVLAGVLRTERERLELLSRFLPKRGDVRPIRVEFNPTAKRGWRNAPRRVTVRHLSMRALDVTNLVTAKVTKVAGTFASARATHVVAGAVGAQGHPRGRPFIPRLMPGEWMVPREREMPHAYIEEALAHLATRGKWSG